MRLSWTSSVLARARQLHGHAQAGQRRAQLVRNIEQQAALGRQQGFDAARHAIEGAGKLTEFVAARGSHAGGQVAGTEPFHCLLQRAHGAGEVQSQPIAQQHGRSHKEEVVGSQEPVPHPAARHFVEEPVAAIVGHARHGVAGDANGRKSGAAHGERHQVRAVAVGQQIAAVIVGEDAVRAVDFLQCVHESLQGRTAAVLVGGARFFQLEPHQPGHRSLVARRVAADVQSRNECRAYADDGQRTPEPKQDLGEEGIHGQAISNKL